MGFHRTTEVLGTQGHCSNRPPLPWLSAQNWGTKQLRFRKSTTGSRYKCSLPGATHFSELQFSHWFISKIFWLSLDLPHWGIESVKASSVWIQSWLLTTNMVPGLARGPPYGRPSRNVSELLCQPRTAHEARGHGQEKSHSSRTVSMTSPFHVGVHWSAN